MPSKQPKCVIIIALFLMLSVPAFGDDTEAQFKFPPSTTPGVEATTPPAGADAAGLGDWTPEDWSAFLQNFIIPLVTLLMGLFGGGLGVRLRDRWARDKKQKKADVAKAERIMAMLSKLVPQVHGKIVLGDKEAKKRDAALAKAQGALNEILENSG